MSRSPATLFAACLVAALLPNLAGADDALLVSLHDVDAAGLDALKSADGVDWWIESGETLLLAGDDSRLRSTLPAARIVRTFDGIDSDELFLHARGCGDTATPIDESLVIVRGGSYDLIRRPRSFSPLTGSVGTDATAHLGAPEWMPVERNSAIARLHRFDRPEGAPPPEDRITAIVDRVDATRWFASVETLASWDRSSFSPELTPARQWIASQFSALGLQVSEPPFTFNYQGSPTNVANVIGRFEGVLFPDEWIVVGGHYDSRQQNITNPVDSPGADDNASGCSGVIEAARAIVDYLPQRTVVFMCYSGEEQGLHGSQAHVNSLQSSGDLAKVDAMLNMDMIGWSADAGLGVILGTRTDVGNPQDNLALVQLLADSALTYSPAFNPNFVTTSTNTCCSDHMPYINAGRPGLMSIHRGSAGAYPHYHETTDTPANLGPHAQDIGNAIVRMNVAALAQLAGTDRILKADNDALP